MDELIKCDTRMIFSIDAVTEEKYEAIRLGSKFSSLLKNLELVNKYKEISGFKLDLVISVVVMKSNYRHLEGFVEFAEKYRIQKLEFGSYIGNSKEENFFKHDEAAQDHLRNSMKSIEDRAKEKNIKVFNRLPYNYAVCDKDRTENFDNSLFCTLPWTSMYILTGGNVIPHGHCKKVIGNIEKDSILGVWNSEAMQVYRKKMIGNDYTDLCGGKTHWMDLI